MMARRSMGLTDKHRMILEFVKEFQEENGYPPTIREIGTRIGVQSTSQVTYYLNQLAAQGQIERNGHTSRSIRVPALSSTPSLPTRVAQAARQMVQAANEIIAIPVLGRIVAGQPIPIPTSDVSYYDQSSSIDLASSLFAAREKVEDIFALEVQGDSMIDAMVNDGDIVVLRKAVHANNGEMVAVWLDDENTTTLKYFHKKNDDSIHLIPANPTMSPIDITGRPFRVMGKVIMVVRQIKNAPYKLPEITTKKGL